MTLYSPPRRNRKRQKEQKDWLLMIVLLILNIVSGYTTIQGAASILPHPSWALFLGLGIQCLLFFALAELILKHAPWVKWLTVLILSFLSIYTSFTTYYTGLTGEYNQKLARDKALKAHNNLIAEVYTPMQERLIELNEEAEYKEKIAECEIKEGCVSGTPNPGPVYRRLQNEARLAKSKAEAFERQFNIVSEKINFDTKDTNLNPEKIYENDVSAFANVPSEFRKGRSLELTDYLDKEKPIELLTPWYKIRKWEQNAIGPFFLALLIDGLSVILGTRITIKKENKSLPILLGEGIAQFIRDVKAFLHNIRQALHFHHANPHRLSDVSPEIRDTGKTVTLNITGQGSDFLRIFNKAIDKKPPYRIDSQTLQQHDNPTFVEGFERIIYRLSHKNVNWIRYAQGNESDNTND